MTSMLIAILYLGVLALDFRPNLKGAKMRDKAIYLAFMTVGFALVVMEVMGVNIASPAYPIERAVHAIFGVK